MAVTRPFLPTPVFAATGAGAWGPVQELRARPEIELVTSPRHAAVLLVAGAVPGEHAEALDRVHDQVPHPRRTVAWTGPLPAAPGASAPTAQPLASTVVQGPAGAAVRALVEAHDRVRADPGASEPDRLPDRAPHEWRGVGPYGQGGEGMMGGTPYGRPMAMTGEDRDGLALDRLHLRLGPFLDALPAGLVLDLTLQGEVIQAAAAVPTGDTSPARGAPVPDPPARDPAAATARRGLRWLAHALHVHGLDADAARAGRLASRLAAPAGRRAPGAGPGAPTAGRPDAHRELGRLRRRVRRSGLWWTLRGVGRVDGRGDAADRWAVHLDRIEAALAGERGARGPRPAPPAGPGPGTDAGLDPAIVTALAGLTVTDAVTTIVSLGPAPHPGPVAVP